MGNKLLRLKFGWFVSSFLWHGGNATSETTIYFVKDQVANDPPVESLFCKTKFSIAKIDHG